MKTWKLVSYWYSSDNLKAGVHSFHGSKRESCAPQPRYIFALPWYVPRLFPTVRPRYKNPPFSWTGLWKGTIPLVLSLFRNFCVAWSSDDERFNRGRCSSCTLSFRGGLLGGPLLDDPTLPSTLPSSKLREKMPSAFGASSGCIISVSESGNIVMAPRKGPLLHSPMTTASTWPFFKLRENISSVIRRFAYAPCIRSTWVSALQSRCCQSSGCCQCSSLLCVVQFQSFYPEPQPCSLKAWCLEAHRAEFLVDPR